MKILFSLIISILFITSCKDYKTPKFIEKEGLSITLPGFVEEEELAADGFMEFANRYRNFYLVILKHKKTNNINQIDSIGTQRILAQLDSVKVDSISWFSNLKVNRSKEIQGNYPKEKEPIYFYHHTLFGKNAIYEVTMWTRGENRKLKYQTEFEKIFNSLNEK
jgi:hypothetical protein